MSFRHIFVYVGYEKMKALKKEIKNTVKTRNKVNSAPDTVSKLFDITKNLESIELEYKIPFSLFVKGYTCNEIAGKLGISVGMVKHRIFFTRNKLTNMLFKYL